MSKLTLTEEEIIEVTGCKQINGQEEWFKINKIPFCKKKGGKLTVIRAWIEQAPFMIASNEPLLTSVSGGKPDFSKVGKPSA